ncbi:MAG: CorA family divalent cation transporter [Flavobacteriales bacterium]
MKSGTSFPNQDSFTENSTSIVYSRSEYSKSEIHSISEIQLTQNKEAVEWVNTYGLGHTAEMKQVISQNGLDDFLIKLIVDQHKTNKLIVLEDVIFLSARVLKTENKDLESEHMYFIMSTNFLWSIQEEYGDYFDFIRERLANNKGLARKKKADYLLFLMLESIIDHYQETFESFAKEHLKKLDPQLIKPTLEFSAEIETKKYQLVLFKKAASSLRDTITKLEKVEMDDFKIIYFSELKDQTHNLIDELDFELHQLESSISLIFSMQGHHLNEVMKTLTIFSVIFIPLTFIAGIYGMNFDHIPGAKHEYGFLILMGVMALLTILSVWYFRRKKWF